MKHVGLVVTEVEGNVNGVQVISDGIIYYRYVPLNDWKINPEKFV